MSNPSRSAPSSPITVDVFKDILRTPEMRSELQNYLQQLSTVPRATAKQLAIHKYLTTKVRSNADISLTCTQIPTDQDADHWYAHQSLLFANFPPGNIFNGLSFVSTTSNADILSKDIISQLIREFPWFQFMKGLSEGTTGYATALTQYNSQNGIIPPGIDSSVIGSIHFLSFLYHAKIYYSRGGTLSFLDIIRPQFEALKASIHLSLCPLYDLSKPSDLYHVGYIIYYHQLNLTNKPYLLVDHFRTLSQIGPKNIFDIHSFRDYLSRVNNFFQIYSHILEPNPEQTFRTYKDLLAYGVSFSPASSLIKSLSASVTTIPAFIQLIYQHEDQLLRSSPMPTTPKPPPSPGSVSANLSPPTKPPYFTPREGKLAKSVVARFGEPPFCCNPTCNKATHLTRSCVQPCKLQGCPCPTFTHKTMSCHMIHNAETATPFFAQLMDNMTFNVPISHY